MDKSTLHLPLLYRYAFFRFLFTMKYLRNVEILVPCNMKGTVIEVDDFNHKSTLHMLYIA